jgi:hypothetical protein
MTLVMRGLGRSPGGGEIIVGEVVSAGLDVIISTGVLSAAISPPTYQAIIAPGLLTAALSPTTLGAVTLQTSYNATVGPTTLTAELG